MENAVVIKRKFEIRYNKILLVQGGILTLLGIAGPFLLPARFPGIYDSLVRAMEGDSAGYLVLAAVELVCMNVIRMIPHYLGVFLINESMHVYIRGKRHFEFNVVVTYALIIAVYETIYYIHRARYDFGFPAVMTVLLVLLLSYLNLFSVSMFNKGFLVGTLLLSI